jgi:lipid-binding SYLF domain-containing protein
MTSTAQVNRPPTSEEAREEARGAAQDVRKATQVLQRMESRSDLKGLLQQAQGVFVVPKFGRAALGIGGHGGVGLLLVRNGSSWSNPAFYNFGGVSAGLQAGVEGGALVLVLNNDKAVNSFLQANNNWSLNANAGLTVVNWSKAAQGSAGKGDVTVWSDAKGLYGALNVGVTDIKYDADQTRAYYGRELSARDVVEGQGVQANADVNALRHTLAAVGSEGTRGAATMHTRESQSGGAAPDYGSASVPGDTGMSKGERAPARSSGTASGMK